MSWTQFKNLIEDRDSNVVNWANAIEGNPNTPEDAKQNQPVSTDPLVGELANRQAILGMNDPEFARLLNISRPLWWLTRNGHRRVHLLPLSGVAKVFPELNEYILTFLRIWNADQQS